MQTQSVQFIKISIFPNVVIRILNTPVSAKMAQGQRKWRAVLLKAYWQHVSIVWDNGFLTDDSKPLHDPKMTDVYDAVCLQ